MTLETVVFPHEPFMKEWYYSTVVGTGTGGGGGGGGWRHDLLGNGSSMVECIGRGGEIRNWETSCSSMVHNLEELDVNNYSSPENNCTTKVVVSEQGANVGKRKRRRTKTCKNKEEVENQRMTHIVVERNRRKQMNEYLAVLRSLMPPSYVQRGDQASIVGGAINFVKELEQLLQSLEGQKQMKQRSASSTDLFITFPQSQSQNPISSSSSSHTAPISTVSVNEVVAENHSSIADIEVTLVESHANLKVFSRRKPRQLLKMVVGLQNLGLTTLHLNLTTIDQMVLYSFSVKVEDDCRLNSADEIATAVYRMMGKIQEESTYN